MAIHDFSSQRLYVDAPLAFGARLECTKDHAHYLLHVLRVGDGATVNIFNGRDGEWRARVERVGKRACALTVEEQIREQNDGPDIYLLFAPLKRARLDYMVQKATELGVARLVPVLTHHTVPDRVNLDRMRANAVEAAEQCGILTVPLINEARHLRDVLTDWDETRRLIFCDEGGEHANPLEALSNLKRGAPLAVIIGPEGGFSEDERNYLNALPFVQAISLGPRVMRADTAATAALAVINAVLGDWC